MTDLDEQPGLGVARSREVRPTWSAQEWTAVASAAGAVDLPPATWAACALRQGLALPGDGLSRCTRRGLLWVQILERWQSIYWGVLAIRGQVPPASWSKVSEVVGRVGILITTESEQVPDLERRRAKEVCGAAVAAVGALGPGVRRRAARNGAGVVGGHRAKLLLAADAHQLLIDRAREGNWTASDYVGSVTATAAALSMADSRATAETAILGQLLTLLRSTAALIGANLAAPSARGLEWDRLAGDIRRAEELVDRARAARAGADTVDIVALAPEVFLSFGWAALWVGSLP